MKNVTIGDIANLAGCSKNTVSLALRGSRRISAKRREHIEEIARSLGYVPHMAARHLSVKRSGYLGIYTRTLGDYVRTALVSKIITGFHGTGMHPILGLGDSPDQIWRDAEWIQTFRAMRAEAIVLVSEYTDEHLLEVESEIPVVMIHCQPQPHLKCDYVGLDRIEASTMGCDHLLSLGRQKILLCGKPGSFFAKGCTDRDKYKKHITLHDTKAITNSEMAANSFAFYRANSKRFDGALFQDSGVAAEFINHAVSAGVSIPRDLSIIAYDCYPQADLLKVGLSTIEQPLASLAEKGIETILKRVRRPHGSQLREVLPHHLVIRESSEK